MAAETNRKSSVDFYVGDLSSSRPANREDEVRNFRAILRAELDYAGVLVSSPSDLRALLEAVSDSSPDGDLDESVAEIEKSLSLPAAGRASFVQSVIREGRDVRGAMEKVLASGVPGADPIWVASAKRAVDIYASLRNGFVFSNLRLVLKVARTYAKRNRHMSFLDLVQEGNLGMMVAADKFDPERGYKFSTYANWWIKQAVRRGLADKDASIRLPVHIHEDYVKLSYMEGKGKTDEQMAEESGLPASKIRLIRASKATMVHLDAPVDDGALGSSATIGDLLRDEGAADPLEERAEVEMKADVHTALRHLSRIELFIIRHRFGLGVPEELTLKEIGDKLNLSRERIRQVEAIALTKIRSRSPGLMAHMAP
jgi:RNA polymerase sigma factor (sigma-70 family)